MNAAVFTFSLCFIGAFAGIIDHNEAGVEVNHACLIEYGINPDLVYNDGSEVTSLTDEQVYCVATCIYRDYGIMRPNGTVDEEKADTYFGEDDSKERDIFFSVYTACKEGKVACKLVQCMFQELKNHWGSSNTTPDSAELSRRFFSHKGLIEFI